MTPGYIEFEFDLPSALLARLVEAFDQVSPEPLLPGNVADIPEAQGVYQLFLESPTGEHELVYIGKTDAEAGLNNRLRRHSKKIQDRVGLDVSKVKFKAVRVFVFTAVDLETQLINHYVAREALKTKQRTDKGWDKALKAARKHVVKWNGSGFGSNDPGINRDTTVYKPEHFDTQFPIDIDRAVPDAPPAEASAAEYLRFLRQRVPYTIRFQSEGASSKAPHPELSSTRVKLDPSVPMTAKGIIQQVIASLPKGSNWHATLLPSHVIIYKDDDRKFPSGKLLARSP